jgi:hypothetical protein
MRPFTTVVALLACSLTSFSQETDVRQLAALRDKKLASPFLRCARWHTRYDEARAAAAESGRPILAYFTRSYAPCGPCVQLEQTVLAKPEFVELSKGAVLFCHVSTHIPTDPDPFLFGEKGGTGFPTLMVLDEKGDILARHCGERSVPAVRRVLDQARAFADMIRRAAAGSDLALKRECLTKQLEFGHLDPEVARARVQELGKLPPDQQAWFETTIVARECDLAFLAIRKAPDEPARVEAARRLVDMKERGRVPSDGRTIMFWQWVMAWAANARDVKLYEEGLLATRALLPDDPSSRELCNAKQEILDRLKRESTLAGAGPMPNN